MAREWSATTRIEMSACSLSPYVLPASSPTRVSSGMKRSVS